MTPDHRSALMGDGTSRANKLHLAITWVHDYGWPLAWQWKGEPFRSRLCFSFDGGVSFQEAKSFDEDVVPTFKFGKEQA